MKSTVVLLGALLSVGAMAVPNGYESKSVEPVPTTTECESATWTPYDYNKSTVVPYEPSYPAPYGPESEVDSTTPGYYSPSSKPVETPLHSGYPHPYPPPEEEPTTTLTSIIESTLTVEISTYEPYGPQPTTEPGYWSTVTTTSCPPSKEGEPGYVPYTPTLTPVPYEYTTPASLYEPETPVVYPTAPVEYPTAPVYYPPGNEPTPSEYTPGNNTYPTSTPPYAPPPYAGSAASLVNNGGFVGMVTGLVGMVAVMIIL